MTDPESTKEADGEADGGADGVRAAAVPESAAAAQTTPGEAKQKRLGKKGLVVFIAFLSGFVPLSTDLYLPALPGMTRYFGVPEYQTNLTLLLFFVFYAVATLFWGPLSDRYGRRPILIIGLVLYTVAGGLCAISTDIFQLIAFRVLQAVGAGAATAVGMAIIKDVYRGRKRETRLALVQSMVVISPAVAPVIGALLLHVTSWRGAFWAQAVLGIGVVAGALAYVETLEVPTQGSVFRAVGRLGVVLKNKTFVILLLVFSLLSIAGMAFITSSSYIYEETFGVSGQVYSYFFALYAVGMAIGPPIYVRLSQRWQRTSIITGTFVAGALSGVLTLVFGGLGPWPFIVALLPSGISRAVMRPPATYLMFDQHERDAGSVSSLTGATHMIMGSIGMLIVSLQLTDRVRLIGMTNLAIGVLCTVLWLSVALPHLAKVKHPRSDRP
jgi:DHA1 family bicyclomycin/chloramphenicol resistance-like MFS transporter